jgi:hypothetical protein
MNTRTPAVKILLLAALPGLLSAQVEIAGKPIQIHGFATQGFGYTDGNNYLTMKTSNGSFAMTDAGLNVSTRLTDRFRVGAQVYVRNFGNLGDWHPQLDWAFADYKFKDWFGIRGGKVKTVLGLYNDTQDMDFLHTFALLPQSVYPTDLRESTIAHTGGDIYGEIPIRHLGSLSYTAYAGQRKDSLHGGYPYMLAPVGLYLQDYGGLAVGADVKWNTPLHGLLVGASHIAQDITGSGEWVFDGALMGGPPGEMRVPYEEHSIRDWTNQFYGQYTRGNLRIDSEYRRYWRDQQIFSGAWSVSTDTRGWYLAGAYRLNKRLELGAYYSRYVISWVQGMVGFAPESPDQDSPDRHIYDKVVAARFDLTRHWNLKVEGHFMDGYGSPGMYPDGFYTVDNPQGLKPTTNFLVLRTGINF